MDTTTYNTLAPDVKTAAKTIGREWTDVIDADDVEQEIWLLLLDRSDELPGEIAALDKPARVSYLTEVGHQIGMQYRDDYELFSGNYTYGTRQVRKMLENDALAGVEEESGIPLWELPETVIKQLQRTDTETVTERIDLMIGMKRLLKRNAAYVDIIKQAYLGTDFDRTNDGKQLTRAVDAVTKEMNRVHIAQIADYTEGPGTRKVLSNSQAQAATAKQYHGDRGEGRR